MHPTPSLVRRSLRLPLRLLTLFAVGGIGYYALELAFRGRSHWSMVVCGGVCLCAVYHMNHRLRGTNIFVRAGIGAAMITAAELVCGCLVNLLMQWHVWDYSGLPFQLWGQICLPFSLLWGMLCIPVCAVCSFVDPISKQAM